MKIKKNKFEILQSISDSQTELHEIMLNLKNRNITSGLDWACTDLDGFKNAHAKRLLLPALVMLKLFPRQRKFSGGCSSVCNSWGGEDWIIFCETHKIKSTKEWKKISPETLSVASHLDFFIKIKNKIESRKIHQILEPDESEQKVLDYIRNHVGKGWREIGRAMEQKLRRTNPFLLIKCNEILKQKRLSKNALHVKTDKEIIEIIKTSPHHSWNLIDRNLHAFLTKHRPHLVLEGNYILEQKRMMIVKAELYNARNLLSDDDLLEYLKKSQETSFQKADLAIYKFLRNYDRSLLEKCINIFKEKKLRTLYLGNYSDNEILEFIRQTPALNWEEVGSTIHSYIWKHRNHLLGACSKILRNKRKKPPISLETIANDLFNRYFKNTVEPFSILQLKNKVAYNWIKNNQLTRWFRAYMQIRQGYFLTNPDSMEYLYSWTLEDIRYFVNTFKIWRCPELGEKYPGLENFLNNKNCERMINKNKLDDTVTNQKLEP